MEDKNTRIIGASVVESIRSDNFWEEVENILAVTKSIFLMIKFCDGEGPKMGELYEKMDNMLGEIKDLMKENLYASYYNVMEKIVVARWEKMLSPLHCLGFALNPKFYNKTYLRELAPGGVARKAPNMDEEVVEGVFEAFRRIAETLEEEELLRKQFAIFNTEKGMFSMATTQLDVVTMDPIEGWSNYGAKTGELAEVAKKVLSQPISSSSAERNWSSYSYIHSVKRNRLNCKRANKLVFIHSNIRLQSRFSESYKDGVDKKWDINADDDFMEGSTRRLEDIQSENLDEEEADNGKGKKQRVE